MKIISIIVLLLSVLVSFGQSDRKDSSIKSVSGFRKNGIFVEMLGNGGAYSLNYERRIKIGKFYLCPSVGYSYLNPLFCSVNGRLMFVTGIGKKNKFEIGPGIIRLYEPEGNVDVALNMNIGTRNEHANGFFYRVNMLAFCIAETAYDSRTRQPYQKLSVMPWIGISFGQAF